jgi:phosphoribosylformylglycinamidine cyclo-ligase
VRYDEAGVSLAAAEAVVDRLRAAVESTRTAGAVGSFGAFAGLYALDEERLLAATTDSVGSKLSLSRRAGRLRDAGVDLGAHCVNDVLTTGAEPLFLLDYIAAGSLDLEEVAELVEGVAFVCRASGCVLVGGETAELPGVYREGELDFAGTCVGLVRRADLIDGSRCCPGDAVLGVPSSGLHTNGFSLVRAVLGEEPIDADLLLAPHRLYLEEVKRLRASVDVRALAHITGGGIPGNLPRALPAGLGAVVDPGSWERPPVFDWLDEHGVPEVEQRRVFNLGIGYCAVVPTADADKTGFPIIGRLEEGVDGVVWADDA